MNMLKDLRPAVRLLLILSVLCGVLYPGLVTLLAQGLFPAQAHGSLVTTSDGRVRGSTLIGQPFADPGHFWGRLSATGGQAYNAAASSGSNLGPLNPALIEAVQARINALRVSDPAQSAPIPVDLVTASGSGLDPHISPAAAIWQAPRVARVRGLPLVQIERLIAQHTEARTFGVLGEPRVNVLALNLALDTP